jgi:uncharacterized OB-fold protein
MAPDARDGAFDDWLDAVAAGEAYYLECPAGHGLLPPRRVCPACGVRELSRRDLPEPGEVLTHTTVAVPTPAFADDAPYVTAIAAFGPVRLTAVVDGEVETGDRVRVGVGRTATRDERVLQFEPV